MEAIKQWAFALCAAMVAMGLAQMLLPKAGFEKVFRLVVSVFFLCCLLSPIVLRSPGLMVDIKIESSQEIERRSAKVAETAEEQMHRSAEESLEQLVRDKLSQRGIKVHALTINIITKGQNAPRLESAVVVLAEERSGGHEQVAKELSQELGCPVRLGYIGEGE